MKKGFTLIELLAVISILALVALITSISVANMLKTSKEDLSDAQIKSIELAAKAWGADNLALLPTGNNCSFITLKDLKENGLLDSNITNPENKEQISNDLKIKIESKLNSGGKSILTYEVNPSDVGTCSYIGNPIYVELPSGLTPVIYDGQNWKVPKVNEEWYNYDKQMWANAVILKPGETKQPGEIVKVDGNNPDALMMLVYIPRFEYRIEGDYGKNGIDEEHPGEIEINFIRASQTEASNDYIIHPAFTFETANAGFWVGKFELSSISTNVTETNNLGCDQETCTSDISKLRILPNLSSLRNNDVSNFWYALKAIENTSSFGLSDVDTHMMKNSDWGAVAYLSQSKYGKYENSDYTGSNKEIYQNKSSDYLTGNSNGTPSQNSYRDGVQCAYNNMTNNCGPGASTTGNIYGVYDMSGGAYEYVMGALNSDGIPKIGSSGFSSNPNVFENNSIKPKYYDVYLNPTNLASNDTTQSCKIGNVNDICYGHALSETLNWYSDSHEMIIPAFSWINRGGVYNVSSAGIFNFTKEYAGAASTNASTRLTIFVK